MGRMKDAHAAALKTMEFEPWYRLDPGLLQTLATGGFEVPAPTPRPKPARPRETGAVPEKPGTSPTKTE